MNRGLIHILISLIFVVIAPLLLVRALDAHDDYARAHAAPSKVLRPSTNPSALPVSLVSPADFHRKAQWSAIGVCALALVSLLAAIRTRHPAWFVCLVACATIAVIATLRTGVRY